MSNHQDQILMFLFCFTDILTVLTSAKCDLDGMRFERYYSKSYFLSLEIPTKVNEFAFLGSFTGNSTATVFIVVRFAHRA